MSPNTFHLRHRASRSADLARRVHLELGVFLKPSKGDDLCGACGTHRLLASFVRRAAPTPQKATTGRLGPGSFATDHPRSEKSAYHDLFALHVLERSNLLITKRAVLLRAQL